MVHKIFVRSKRINQNIIEHEFAEKHDSIKEIILAKAFSFHKSNKEEASKILSQDKYKTGIYILRGPKEDKTHLYVGKGNVIDRLNKDHDKKDGKYYKPWWNDAIFFTDTDKKNTVLSSCAANFEYKLYGAIREEICVCTNKSKVSNPAMTDDDEMAVNSLSENIFEGLEIIGWPYFLIKPSIPDSTKETHILPIKEKAAKASVIKTYNDSSRIYVMHQKNITAEGQYAADRSSFIVFKNSEASNKLAPAFNEFNEKKPQMKTYSKKQKELVKNKILVLNEDGSNYVFVSDYKFKNANEAACIILGGSITGKKCWIDKKENMSIFDIENNTK